MGLPPPGGPDTAPSPSLDPPHARLTWARRLREPRPEGDGPPTTHTFGGPLRGCRPAGTPASVSRLRSGGGGGRPPRRHGRSFARAVRRGVPGSLGTVETTEDGAVGGCASGPAETAWRLARRLPTPPPVGRWSGLHGRVPGSLITEAPALGAYLMRRLPAGTGWDSAPAPASSSPPTGSLDAGTQLEIMALPTRPTAAELPA